MTSTNCTAPADFESVHPSTTPTFTSDLRACMAIDMDASAPPPPPSLPPPPKTAAVPAKVPRAAEDASDSQDAGAKYRRYEKEYLRRINHKYFSGTTPSGEPVFESSTTIDGFLFKESKVAPLKRFMEGPSLVDERGKAGVSLADAGPMSSGRKSLVRKS